MERWTCYEMLDTFPPRNAMPCCLTNTAMWRAVATERVVSDESQVWCWARDCGIASSKLQGTGVAVGSRPSNLLWQLWDGGGGMPGQALVLSLCVWTGSGGLASAFVPVRDLASCYWGEQHFPFSCLDTFPRIALCFREVWRRVVLWCLSHDKWPSKIELLSVPGVRWHQVRTQPHVCLHILRLYSAHICLDKLCKRSM